MKKLIIIAAAALFFTACTKDSTLEKTPNTVFRGAPQTFQHGKAWTWYEEDASGNPKRLAIAIDDEAMASLDRTIPGSGGHQHNNALSLALHPKAGITPFTHVLLDWNPVGHEPEVIYGKPHFDFHFYTSTEAERLAIPTYEQATAAFDNFPAPVFFPPTYVPGPGGVPAMGKHWVDVTSPEFNGSPFTQTFIYGSYDGKVTFYEPMITEEFIRNNSSFERSIPQPAQFQKAGWYPTKMRIAKTGGVTSVIIEDFVLRSSN